MKTAANIVYAIMLPKRSHYAYTRRWQQAELTHTLIKIDHEERNENL